MGRLDVIFDNSFQDAATKFKSEFMDNHKSSKPIYTAPEIRCQETFANGEVWYHLLNGNSILKEKYDAMWHPHKQAIHPKGHKGDNPDKTKVK